MIDQEAGGQEPPRRHGTPSPAVHGRLPDSSLRWITAEDWRSWRDLRLRALAEAPDAYGATLTDAETLTEAQWRERCRHAVLVVESDEPVAMGSAYVEGNGLLQIVSMWTAPSARGHGLARRVLDALVDRAHCDGLDVQIAVTLGNDAARAAYERYGFVGTGELHPLREGSSLRVERMVLPRRPPVSRD